MLTGNMLIEVISSQLLRENPTYSFREEMNFEDCCERAPNFALLQMLDAIAGPPEECTHNLDPKQKNMPLIQKGNADLSDELSELDPDPNLHPLAAHLPGKDNNSAQPCSSSHCSEFCSNLVVHNTEESFIMHCRSVTLDEGTSSGTHDPNSSNSGNFCESHVDTQPATSDIMSVIDQTIAEHGRLGFHTITDRKKRKRSRACKNSEEVESQRMTHIAVERNRRKQMNEHLSILRSLMPGSYVQRGDQASIIGGAIEFVKELEQVLHSLQTQKRRRDSDCVTFNPRGESLLSEFMLCTTQSSFSPTQSDTTYPSDDIFGQLQETFAESSSSVAEVEVKMIGSHAVVKILSHKRPGQLLRTIAAMESLSLMIIHLNVTTIEQTVLYSFNLKTGMDCKLHTVRELATSVQHIMGMIHADTN